MSSMESQFREIVRQRIVDALAARPPALTRRDVRLPAVPGKAVAVIGAQRSSLEKDLLDYLAAGGFPESQGLNQRDRNELLRGYVDVALLRDVVERHAVSHPVALRWMVRQLLGNAAGSFSVNKFHGDLKSQGIPIAKDTLHSYLGYLEDAFLVRMVSIAADSERRRMVNPRKVYPIDPGLIPLFDRSGKSNRGHALETCMMLELDRRGAEVGYVHTAADTKWTFSLATPEARKNLSKSVPASMILTSASAKHGRCWRPPDIIQLPACTWSVSISPYGLPSLRQLPCMRPGSGCCGRIRRHDGGSRDRAVAERGSHVRSGGVF